MISSKRTNLIRAKLLTYTFRELYPVCRVNNKTKINSMSFKEINMQYDKYIIVEKDIISSPSHNVKYGVDLHHNNLLRINELSSNSIVTSNTLENKKVLVSQKKIRPRRKSSKNLNINSKKVDSTLNTCSTLTQSYQSDCNENDSIKILRHYLHTLKKPKRKVNSNADSCSLRKYSDSSSYKATKNKSPTVTHKGNRSIKECLENIHFSINKKNDIEFHFIDVKPLEIEPEPVGRIIKLHRMFDN